MENITHKKCLGCGMEFTDQEFLDAKIIVVDNKNKAEWWHEKCFKEYRDNGND